MKDLEKNIHDDKEEPAAFGKISIIKRTKLLGLALFFLSSILFSSCEVIGGIFKTGVGVGVLLVVIVIVVIVIIVMRAGKK
jgi:uncharacterized membrane protein YhhN